MPVLPPAVIMKSTITLPNFAKYVEDMSANDKLKFHEEYMVGIISKFNVHRDIKCKSKYCLIYLKTIFIESSALIAGASEA